MMVVASRSARNRFGNASSRGAAVLPVAAFCTGHNAPIRLSWDRCICGHSTCVRVIVFVRTIYDKRERSHNPATTTVTANVTLTIAVCVRSEHQQRVLWHL